MINSQRWLRLIWAALISRSNQAFYDRISPFYDEVFVEHRVHAENITGMLSEFYAGKEDETLVLDLGCGTGMLSRMLADRGFSVIGLDVSFESLRILNQGDAQSIVVQADAAYLPAANGCLQAVVCLGVWRHFQNPKQVLDEIVRALTPNGTLLIGYFPPAVAGAIHVGRGRFSNLIVWLYEVVTKKLGYTDRVNSELEEETVAAAEERFTEVCKVASGARWHLILARYPTKLKTVT